MFSSKWLEPYRKTRLEVKIRLSSTFYQLLVWFAASLTGEFHKMGAVTRRDKAEILKMYFKSFGCLTNHPKCTLKLG